MNGWRATADGPVVQATAPGLLAARYPVRAVDDDPTSVVKGDRRMVDVIDLHLDARDAIPGILKLLRFVQVRVHQLGIVLIEAGVEDPGDTKLLGHRSAN